MNGLPVAQTFRAKIDSAGLAEVIAPGAPDRLPAAEAGRTVEPNCVDQACALALEGGGGADLQLFGHCHL